MNSHLPVLKKTNGNFQEFQKIAKSTGLLSGIDNTVELDDDEAYELGKQYWLEINDSIGGDSDAIFSFVDYLKLIASRAKGFTYKLAEDTSGNKKKLVGVVWMTATMRRNFELFGGYISLDMMKRGLNTLLWPYVAVSMYDEDMKLCIACEGILCKEKVDMYKLVADFTADSAPGRPLSEVNVVAGDSFFDQDMIVEFGFVNASFIMDHFHLYISSNPGLAKIFGKAGYELLKGHLVSMIQANSEEDFDSVVDAARQLLHVQTPRNGQIESDLKKFANKRSYYAQCCLDMIPGNRGIRGSSVSEQNNSSLNTYLNDGNKYSNEYTGKPIDMVSRLLDQ